jgi:hypothetical protein
MSVGETGAGFPAPAHPLATGAPSPCPEGRGSCSSSAPRATAGEAVRSWRPKPSARPEPRPPAARRADAGRPTGMDGATERGRLGDPLKAPRGRSPRNPPILSDRCRASRRARTGGPRALPSRRFQALLTLFSESFSSFPRGTCSLSVSRPCLALGGAYHPLGAAFPSSPTLGADNVRHEAAGTPTSTSRTGLSPSAAPRPRGFREACLGRVPTMSTHEATIRGAFRHPDLGLGLFPLRSPLLGESWLVSFPPLNDMLKSGG